MDLLLIKMIKMNVVKKIIYLLFFLISQNLFVINKLDYKSLFADGKKEVLINNGLLNSLDCNDNSIDFLLKKKY